MKRVLVGIAAALLFATLVVGAPLQRVPKLALRSKVMSIDQLKAINLRTPPTKVMNGQLNFGKFRQLRSNLNIGTTLTAFDPAAAARYKTGSGVVLKPSVMTDSETKSELHLFGAQMDQKLVDSVVAKSDAPVSMSCAAGQHANLGFLMAYFRSLPKGNHLYMLTLHMSVAQDRGNYLQVLAGSSGIESNAITRMGDDYHALLSFDPAGAGDGTLQVLAKFNMPQDDALAFLQFSHLQLARID